MSEELIQIYESPSANAEQLKAILEDMGINVFLKNEMMGQMYPLYASPGGINPVKVYVNKNDETEAKKIIENYFGS